MAMRRLRREFSCGRLRRSAGVAGLFDWFFDRTGSVVPSELSFGPRLLTGVVVGSGYRGLVANESWPVFKAESTFRYTHIDPKGSIEFLFHINHELVLCGDQVKSSDLFRAVSPLVEILVRQLNRNRYYVIHRRYRVSAEGIKPLEWPPLK